jgi:hypothetical protein
MKKNKYRIIFSLIPYFIFFFIEILFNFKICNQTAIFHQMHPSSGTPYKSCIRVNNNLYPGNLTLSDLKGPNGLHPTWSPAFEMFFLNDDRNEQKEVASV